MQTFIEAQAIAGHVRMAAAFAAWLRDRGGDELVEAAELLGRPDWVGRARAIMIAVKAGGSPADHLPELRALHRLLQLEYADRLGSLEAALFASVHPDDPRADNARISAEALARGVASLEALDRIGIRTVQEAA